MNPWWINQAQNKKVIEKTKAGLFEHRQKHQKFYQTKAWQQLRLYKLSIDPLWETCLLSGHTTPATETDHVIPIIENFGLRLSLGNLQSLCKMHHSKKTVGEVTERKKEQQRKVIDANMDELDDF
jgi:5-methylcytosine-specific restriction endonuclease McrA